jgi:hypothetical protein
MNGLDGLYSQTLTYSQHLPHFHNIISTIALLFDSLPIVKISALLGIEAFEVVRVLLNLQAIIHVPGTDEEGQVTLCHTSLRDFLTTKSRSGPFFVPRSFHLYLSYYCFSSLIGESNAGGGTYSWHYFDSHWQSFAGVDDCDFLTEIECFKACQPLLVSGVSYHSFLCSILFFAFSIQSKNQLLNGDSYMLTECANQLVLAAECAEPHTRRWLDKQLPPYMVAPPSSTSQFTEQTYEALQHDLQRASTAIRANVFLNFTLLLFVN